MSRMTLLFAVVFAWTFRRLPELFARCLLLPDPQLTESPMTEEK